MTPTRNKRIFFSSKEVDDYWERNGTDRFTVRFTVHSQQCKEFVLYVLNPMVTRTWTGSVS